MSISQTILDIAEICAQQGVNKLVLSPGSRNAPLTLAFSRHPQFSHHLISDERVAGYVALGMAQSVKHPIILLCTSGTAALNFGPAISEAFYQRIPLLVFTADRPPEWIDQNDGQAIRQRNVFENHVKKSFELPVSPDHKDARWQIHRIVNEAIITSHTGVPGPVHINVPLREPLYPSDQSWDYNRKVPIIKFRQTNKTLSQKHWSCLMDQWASANKILIVGGQNAYSTTLIAALAHVQSHMKVPVLGDVVSNLHRMTNTVRHPEIILAQEDTRLEALHPDLLISFGGNLVSKNLKLFLRRYPASNHWHIQETEFPPDTFQNLSEIIPMDPGVFFSQLSDVVPSVAESTWYQRWQTEESRACERINSFVQNQPFCELQAVDMVLNAAKNKHLHMANSAPVRWADLIGIAPEIIEISANRGTSGIDGCTSTAVGHALTNGRQNLLITGDMALFYDRNAFWHQYKIPNLKIVLLNNHGGGIFRLLDGPRKQPELEELFVTTQSLSAVNFAQDFGMKYLYCNNAEDLTKNLRQLFEPYDQACILEIKFPNHMGDIYQELKASFKNSYD